MPTRPPPPLAHAPHPIGPPPMQPQTGSTFRERLGYYAIGVAIGLVLVGMLWQARSNARSAPASPAPTPPPATR